LCIGLVILFQGYGNSILIGVIAVLCLLFNWTITFFLRSKERENLALRNLFI